MPKIFMGNALWTLVAQSDGMSILVLLLLLVMSILCWSIFFYKLILFSIKKRQLINALEQIKKTNNLEQLITLTTQTSGTMPGYFLAKNLTYLKSMLESRNPQHETEYTQSNQLQTLQENIYATVDSMARYEESYLSTLSASMTISPLLGLFGTIWGLIHAFISISEKQSADIATVAPGMAEALITTLVGLMVAIPAAVMYNVINAQLNTLEHKLESLADKFYFIVQKIFMR